MRNLMMAIMLAGSICLLQIGEAQGALLPNEIKVLASSVKHGPEFGADWTKEQEIVWGLTEKWWQLRIKLDWTNLQKLYHKDAIIYSYFHKVPYDLDEQIELSKNKVFGVAYCTVHDIRIFDNTAIVMLYYEITDPIAPKRMIFVWEKYPEGWKLISTMNKEEY